MQQIVSPSNLTQKILGQQKMDEGASYRLSTHCVCIEQPEGVLFFHTLTGELLLLSHAEAEQIAELPGRIPAALTELAPRWFLMPEGADDMAMVDRVRSIILNFRSQIRGLTEYMIYTTTACNARCFYCFEAGMQRTTMSEETARAAAAYIANHCGGRKVNLVWFGGEPMLNVRAIDTITGELRRRGVEFRSRMDSNGSLFDEALAARAKADWNIYEIQITIDGTEEVYNRRKAYVHSEESPYRRVLRNIGLLLDAGAPVRVRLNLDEDNERDLYALVDELAARFAGKPGFCVSVRAIIENKGSNPNRYTEEERCSLGEKTRALWAYLDERGLAAKVHLPQSISLFSCWGNNANGTTITPDGRLGRCESHIDTGLWGSVFSEERDTDVLRQWQERREPKEVCQTCAFYPRCTRLKKCAIHPVQCSPVERAEMRINLTRAMLATYDAWKAGTQEV